jgi:hypothetical protein
MVELRFSPTMMITCLIGLAVWILSTALSGSAAWPAAMQASAEAANAARPVAARRDRRMVIAMGILLE